MGRGKYSFYTRYKEEEENRNSSLSKYIKLTIPYIAILVLVWLVLQGTNSNSAKVGNVGNVGGSITIYNSDGKRVPSGHVNITKKNREDETKFLTYLALLEDHNINIKNMLISINNRLVALSEEASCYNNLTDNGLSHTHITFWYKECGDGYTTLNGTRIDFNDVRESFGTSMYPNLTKLFSNGDIVPCIYIGK